MPDFKGCCMFELFSRYMSLSKGCSKFTLPSYLCPSLPYCTLPLLLLAKHKIERGLCTYVFCVPVPKPFHSEPQFISPSHGPCVSIKTVSFLCSVPTSQPSRQYILMEGHQFTLYLMTWFIGFRSYSDLDYVLEKLYLAVFCWLVSLWKSLDL